VAYFNGLNGELVSDDVYAIRDTEHILRTPQYFLHPISFISRTFLYFLVYKIDGINPFYYRLINIIFHIGVTGLVFAIVPFFSKKKFLAFMVAAFTAVHPVMIESVTWISGGVYSQSVFFVLLSFLLFLHFLENNKKHFFIFSLISFIFALSASEKAIVFPAVLFLYVFLFDKEKYVWKKTIPYFVISTAWIVMLIPRIAPRLEFIQEDSGIVMQPINVFIQIPVVIFTYFKLLFWPTDLTLYHSEFALTMLQVVIAYVVLFGAIGYAIYTYKSNKFYFFWFAFLFITLSPTLTPFGISALVAERYVYIGSIGIYFIVGSYLMKLIEHKKYEIVGYILFFVLIISLLIRTMIRNNDWKTADNLWKSTAEVSPNNPKSLNNVAKQYSDSGNYDKAIRELEKAIQLNPNFPHAYHNLGHIYQIIGKQDLAITYYEKAIKLNPKLWQTRSNLAEVYVYKGLYDNALKELTAADAINPNNPDINHNIGHAYQKKEDFDSAMNYYNKVLSLNPKFVQTLENIGVIYFIKKYYSMAVKYFKNAIELSPENSKLYASIGIVYLRSGDLSMAQKSFEKSLSINPNEQLAQSGLKEIKR
jgi:tetratricopeptide (TPR) repeat protein